MIQASWADDPAALQAWIISTETLHRFASYLLYSSAAQITFATPYSPSVVSQQYTPLVLWFSLALPTNSQLLRNRRAEGVTAQRLD
ncbi:MAG TPA: hypothetical protein VMF56_16555, partial [Acidobacteriaceae bacterium]|nr:hypothetical protein [Acidobacteriaceae bacterium]